MRAYRAKLLYDGNRVRRDVFVIVEKEKIVDVTKEEPDCDVVDCDVITPAFIDAHSHIGMSSYGEPVDEDESNDTVSQILPVNNPLNSIYFDDKAFEEAVEHGVLYSIVVPGSGNVVGGQAVLIRNFARNRAEGFVKQVGYKMALGFNPRSTTDWKGTRPSTRMGVYALLEARLEKLKAKLERFELEKRAKERKLEKLVKKKRISEDEMREELEFMEKEFLLSLSPADKHLISLLRKEKMAKVHVHKEDDVIYLIELRKRFGIRATAEHLCDVHRKQVFNMLARVGIDATYGPVDSFPYKVELKHESYKNVKLLIDSKLRYCLMTDHPVVLARNLFMQGRFFLRYGLKRHEVIAIMTRNAAEIHGIDELGTVEEGKLASFVIWDGDPFSLDSKVVSVVCEGKHRDIKD